MKNSLPNCKYDQTNFKPQTEHKNQAQNTIAQKIGTLEVTTTFRTKKKTTTITNDNVRITLFSILKIITYKHIQTIIFRDLYACLASLTRWYTCSCGWLADYLSQFRFSV